MGRVRNGIKRTCEGEAKISRVVVAIGKAGGGRVLSIEGGKPKLRRRTDLSPIKAEHGST